MIKALEQFKEASSTINDLWGTLDEKDFNAGCIEYPFSVDFAEVNSHILDWVYEFSNALEESSNEHWCYTLGAKYKDIKPALFGWHDDNTGGNCMVFYKNYICLDGVKRVVGLNDEGICLYNIDYETSCTPEWYDHNDWCESVICDVGTDTEESFAQGLQDLATYLTSDQITDITHGLGIYCGKYLDC